MRTLRLALLAGTVSVLALMSPAKADLVYQGLVDLGGTGLGAVPTIMTMTSHAAGSQESGQVSWNGISNVVTADPNPPGYTLPGTTDMTGINNTITMQQTGFQLGTNSGLAIIFNPAEPGPGGGGTNHITLNNLVMTIYDGLTGTIEFTAPWLGGPMDLAAIDQGTGNSGYEFALNSAEIAELNAVAGLGLNDRIGLFAYATNATGGQETFFGTVIADPDPVPEPSTLAMLGGWLAVFGVLGWMRHRKEKDSSNFLAA